MIGFIKFVWRFSKLYDQLGRDEIIAFISAKNIAVSISCNMCGKAPQQF